MRWGLTLLGVLLPLTFPFGSTASAQAVSGDGTASRKGGGQCAYTGWAGDGCAGADGSFLIAAHYGAASFAAFATQSGQRWSGGAHPWNWNSPGIDYPVGPPAGLVLADPATAVLPEGCVYQPTGSAAHGPVVYCSTGAVNPTLSGLNFGLHGCVQFMATHNVEGTLTIQNSYFRNGPNCSVTFGSLIRVISGNMNVVLNNDLIDEAYPEYTTPLISTVAINTVSSSFTVTNTAVINASQRPLSGSSTGPVLIQNSVFVGMNLASTTNTGEHGEIFELDSNLINPLYSQIQYINNVVVIPAATNSAVTTPFYSAGTQPTFIHIDQFTVSHNVSVINTIDGVPRTAALNIRGVVSGNLMTVYPGYEGEITPRAAIVGLPAGVNPTAATILTQLGPRQYQLSGAVNSGRFAGARTMVITTSAALVELGHAGSYGTVTIEDNFVDPTGALSCIQHRDGPISAAQIDGNVSLVTGTAVSGFGYGQDGARCGPLF